MLSTPQPTHRREGVCGGLVRCVSAVVKFHFMFPVISEFFELVWLLSAVLEWDGGRGR